MVRLYRDAGGIIFCKTNVPQVSPPLTCQGYELTKRPCYHSNVRIRFGGLLPILTTASEHAEEVQVVRLSWSRCEEVHLGGVMIVSRREHESMIRQDPPGSCEHLRLPGNRHETVLILVAGSLRIPSHFSGCCALKPWPGRLPIQYSNRRIESQEAVKVSLSSSSPSL
jgi:hypothetical protein